MAKVGQATQLYRLRRKPMIIATQGAWIGRYEGAYENRDKDRVAAINAKNMADAEKLRETGADAEFIANAGIAKNETEQGEADNEQRKADKDAKKTAALEEQKRWASLTPSQRKKEYRKRNR
jgi:hypothetical protein